MTAPSPKGGGAILRVQPYKHNGGLIANAHKLGHIFGRVLDASWGRGVWWQHDAWDGIEQLVGMDIDWLKATGEARGMRRRTEWSARGDFRRPPFRPQSFDTVLLDADYKLNGTPTTAESKWVKTPQGADVDERYGAHVRKRWEERMGDLLDGVAWWPICVPCNGVGYRTPLGALIPDPCPECKGGGYTTAGLAPLVKPRGRLLVKCMNQVVSGTVRFQPYEVAKRAEAAGFVLIEQLDMLTRPREQPPGRRQKNAASNTSSLMIFRPAPSAKQQVKA
ncbi:MAG TPA: hypothetical protein VJ140_14030 [Actinomycetota bacterium]|nr:hypothetical protein [Actinomycetota bacterium]